VRYAVREGSQKYIVSFSRANAGGIVSEELFDLEADPGERRSLDPEAHALRGIAERYVATADERARDRRRALLSTETSEQLRALGYIQ